MDILKLSGVLHESKISDYLRFVHYLHFDPGCHAASRPGASFAAYLRGIPVQRFLIIPYAIIGPVRESPVPGKQTAPDQNIHYIRASVVNLIL